MSKKQNFDLLGRLVTSLMTIPQYWGILVDLAEKLDSQQGETWAKEFAKFLRKEATWQEGELLILNTLKIESHKKDAFESDPSKITIYLSEGQKKGKGTIRGFDLQDDLDNQPVLNACTLDHFLAHPELIPEEWKSIKVFFWGTVYSQRDGYLCVRYLFWDGYRWGWDYKRTDSFFHCNCTAACLKVA